MLRNSDVRSGTEVLLDLNQQCESGAPLRESGAATTYSGKLPLGRMDPEPHVATGDSGCSKIVSGGIRWGNWGQTGGFAKPPE